MTQPTYSHLADLPEPALWSSLPWPEFSRLKDPKRHLALLPLFGFADWGLGRALDLEETLGCGVLRAMLDEDRAPFPGLTILPPVRFLLGPYPHTLFGVTFETALDLVHEIATSIKAAGLRRLVLFNTSPWNEELIDTCGRDLRVALGLNTFCINLEALGFDLHPTRSTTRPDVQLATCALTGRLPSPSPDSARGDIRLPGFRPGDHRQPGPLAFTKSIEEAITQGRTVISRAGARLADLLREIGARKPLAHDGAIPQQQAPATTRRKRAVATAAASSKTARRK